MAKELSTLLPLMQIPRCPQPAMLQALRNACRCFCRDTEIWRLTLDDFNTVEDQADYELDLVFESVLLIRVSGVEVDSIPQSEDRWRVSTDATLTLDPAPNADDKVVSVAVVLLPAITCNEVADFLVDRWGEAIAAKAAFDLKTDKGSKEDPVPWYDPESAGLWLKRYNDGVGDAKAEVFSQMQSGEQILQINPWGRK